MPEFRNASKLEFCDLTSEEWREYQYASGTVRLVATHLHVSASGGHRLFTTDGLSHYMPPGWIRLTWKAKEGSPHFDF